MSVLNNRTITDGLVFNFDVNNVKSYAGEPTTNIIPSPSYNAIPTYGNSWGTYNTNQYNNAQYFSIGTISSVTNNIVTTSGNHPLRTYDVVQPQTTGGGLTAGQVYLIKKLSNTTFTIHDYNGSQDGSQGYINPSTGNHKVWDSLATDTRVSINSTNFPTMWWGPPHYPNSGLVKEIIPNGFDAIPGQVTDCIRLHYARPEVDGMSYGVDCTVTPGIPYNISFWTRSADVNAVGKSVYYYNYNYNPSTGAAAGYAFTFYFGPLGVWQKQSYSFTYAYSTIISYWFSNNNGPYRWDMSNIQVEQKDHATAFSLGTRSNTQGLLDLTGNATLDLTNTAFDSNGAITFNNSGYIIGPENSVFNNQAFTMECWCNPTTTTQNGFLFEKGQVNTQYSNFFNGDGTFYFRTMSLSNQDLTFTSSTYVTVNKWNHIVCAYNGSTKYIYVNGVLVASTSCTGTSPTNANGISIGVYGGYNGTRGYTFSGQIAISRVYNKGLNASEVLQNYNATKSRFGL